MVTKRITWADAEKLVHGIEAEWRKMVGAEDECMPPSNIEVRLEHVQWADPLNQFIAVIEIDSEDKWDIIPEWRRWFSGGWTKPMSLLKRFVGMISIWSTPHETIEFDSSMSYEKYRKLAKPILFHLTGCQHPKTATCTCGKEPFYSPTERRKRGEIE